MGEFMFSDNQKQKFEEDGFLVLENFFTDLQCDEIQKECYKLVEEMKPEEHTVAFSTDKHEQMKSDYFLQSNDKIRFFWEPLAKGADGKLLRNKHEALNKIGHALHILNPVFKAATFDNRIKTVLRRLGFVHPVVPQSMYIFKPPGIGGEVNRHIDATFLYSDPLKLMGLWIPLENATEENGCLWFVPGSHKTTQVTKRMVRNPIEGATPATIFEGDMADYPFDQYKITPAKRGSLVLIDGKVHHFSKQNNSAKSRHVYTFHVTESNNTQWSPRNWLQPPDGKAFPTAYNDATML